MTSGICCTRVNWSKAIRTQGLCKRGFKQNLTCWLKRPTTPLTNMDLLRWPQQSFWVKQNRTSILWKQTQCQGINEDLVCAKLELVIKLLNQHHLMCLDMEIDEMYWQRATVWSMRTSVPARPSDPTYFVAFQHLHSDMACFLKAPNLYITKCYWWLLKRFLKSEIDGTEVFLNIGFLGQFLLRDTKKEEKMAVKHSFYNHDWNLTFF